MQKIAAREEKILRAGGMRMLGHDVNRYANIKPCADSILAPASSREGPGPDGDHRALGGCGRGGEQETLPVTIDRFLGRLHAISDDDVAAGPAEHFKKSSLAFEFTDFGMDDLAARKIDAPALFPALDFHGTGGHDAAFHLDQVGERSAAGNAGESGQFVSGSSLHRMARTPGSGTLRAAFRGSCAAWPVPDANDISNCGAAAVLDSIEARKLQLYD